MKIVGTVAAKSARKTRNSPIDLVAINRVSKTVRGQALALPLWSLSATSVAASASAGKAKEVQEAIRKATKQAKRGLIRVPLRDGRTLHHDIEGRHGAGKVIMRTAVPGTGIIAGGPMRAVFEMLGVQDVVAKSHGVAEPLQHDPRHHRRPEKGSLARKRRPASWQESGRDPALERQAGLKPSKRKETDLWLNHRREADRFADPPPRHPARDAEGPGPEQDEPHPRAGEYPAVRGMVAKIPHLAVIIEERGDPSPPLTDRKRPGDAPGRFSLPMPGPVNLR